MDIKYNVYIIYGIFQEKKQQPVLTDRKKTLEERAAGRNDKFAALKAKRENKIQKGKEFGFPVQNCRLMVSLFQSHFVMPKRIEIELCL